MDYDFTYTGAEIQAILDTAKKLKDSGYIFLGVATPSTNPGTPTQKVYYEAKQAGTYTNFGGLVLPDGISLLIWNGSWTSETVMCGDGGVFDISVYKSSGGTLATYADLAAALDGGNNIPASARKGGMSVKFVQSSDNKYVQYRLKINTFSTDVTNWLNIDCPELDVVYSHGNLNFFTIQGKVTWDESIGLYYGGQKYTIQANNEGITFAKTRFVFIVWDKETNTITTKNINTFDGYLIAVITYTSNTNFERVNYSLLPYTVDGVKYGKNAIQQEAFAGKDIVEHLFNVDYNLQAYVSEFGWPGASGNMVVTDGALHKEIPVCAGMKLKLTGGQNNSYIVFASSVVNGVWDRIGERITINANETLSLTVPSNAHYLIVGDRNGINVSVGHYLPSSLQLSLEESFKCNTRPTSTDLDDYNKVGWYQLSSSTFYTNSPCILSKQPSVIINYNWDGDEDYLVQEFRDLEKGLLWTRIRRTDGLWSDWVGYTTGNNINYSFSSSSIASQGENKGHQMKIMSYNVAMYNNDTATFVSDTKLLNLRKMLNDGKPDFIGMQEGRKYIDSANTKTSLAYLFNPVYPYQYSTPKSGETAELGVYIYSKIQAITSGGLFYSNYPTRPKIEYATYTIGNKVLLFISTHTVAQTDGDPESQASINARIANYAELFGWVNGTIDLKNVENNDVHVPTHDWCIIVGDMNTITDADKTNLTNAASNAGYVLGNGGYLGWLKTALRYSGSMTSLDNIIVSDNVIVNSFTSYSEWYDRLYSDHVPVMADVTLLDT